MSSVERWKDKMSLRYLGALPEQHEELMRLISLLKMSECFSPTETKPDCLFLFV